MRATHLALARLLKCQEASIIVHVCSVGCHRILIARLCRARLAFDVFMPGHGKVIGLIQLRSALEVFDYVVYTSFLLGAGRKIG